MLKNIIKTILIALFCFCSSLSVAETNNCKETSDQDPVEKNIKVFMSDYIKFSQEPTEGNVLYYFSPHVVITHYDSTNVSSKCKNGCVAGIQSLLKSVGKIQKNKVKQPKQERSESKITYSEKGKSALVTTKIIEKKINTNGEIDKVWGFTEKILLKKVECYLLISKIDIVYSSINEF